MRVIANLSFVVICVGCGEGNRKFELCCHLCLHLFDGLNGVLIDSFHLHALFLVPLTRIAHRGATLALEPGTGLYCNTYFAFQALSKGRDLHLFPSALVQE